MNVPNPLQNSISLQSNGKFLLNSPWDPPYLFLSLGLALAFPPPWTVPTTARTSPFYALLILEASAQVPVSPW